MILIADSGSTKTSWAVLLPGHKVRTFQTPGYNPYVQKKEEILKNIREEVVPALEGAVPAHIFFYGAGCSSAENKAIMYDCFKHSFKNSAVEIEHDLMAAARALWFHKPGIAAILGTGSNSCLYNGHQITDGITSLGFILGDEGSGAWLGKALIRDFAYRQMPRDIAAKFNTFCGLDVQGILNRIYKGENPNRWLAGFSLFIGENIQHDYCKNLVMKAFEAFFDAHLVQYRTSGETRLGVVGSIGYFYREILEIVTKKYGFSLEKVIKSPIEELVKYHEAQIR